MAKKKQLNDNKSQNVWQYIYLDSQKRVCVSESKFLSTDDAKNFFKLLKKERRMEGCNLIGYAPSFQVIYA